MKALVMGAGGFIGSHLVRRLKREGYWVRGVDLKLPEFAQTAADDFVIADLRDQASVRDVFGEPFDEVYQLAADMGGAGYVFTGDHDADVRYSGRFMKSWFMLVRLECTGAARDRSGGTSQTQHNILGARAGFAEGPDPCPTLNSVTSTRCCSRPRRSSAANIRRSRRSDR